MEQYNSVKDRTCELEKRADAMEEKLKTRVDEIEMKLKSHEDLYAEKLKVANHRIDDLEKGAG